MERVVEGVGKDGGWRVERVGEDGGHSHYTEWEGAIWRGLEVNSYKAIHN